MDQQLKSVAKRRLLTKVKPNGPYITKYPDGSSSRNRKPTFPPSKFGVPSKDAAGDIERKMKEKGFFWDPQKNQWVKDGVIYRGDHDYSKAAARRQKKTN